MQRRPITVSSRSRHSRQRQRPVAVLTRSRHSRPQRRPIAVSSRSWHSRSQRRPIAVSSRSRHSRPRRRPDAVSSRSGQRRPRQHRSPIIHTIRVPYPVPHDPSLRPPKTRRNCPHRHQAPTHPGILQRHGAVSGSGCTGLPYRRRAVKPKRPHTRLASRSDGRRWRFC